MNRLRIAYVSSELSPFAKVGGLGDVAAALPTALHELGHDVRPFLPLYGVIDTHLDFSPVVGLAEIPVSFGNNVYSFSVFTSPQPGTGLNVYFIHCPALYGRPHIYTRDEDEHIRFLLLSRAVLEICQRMGWSPDVIQCNDWQTALVPLFLKTHYAWDRLFENTHTVLTIHNLGYQGVYPSDILPHFRFEGGRELFDKEDLQSGQINFLKTGIRYADRLTTVSPTYAKEIQTETYGMGLHGLLRERSADLVGILNGVDYGEWNPKTDRLIPYRYSEKSLWRKTRNKRALLNQYGLGYAREIPLVGMVSRLAAQKGLDLLPPSLPAVLAGRDVRMIVLGSGESKYEEFLHGLQAAFPDKVRFHNGFSNELAHLVEAASDAFLMPSKYEPCGLNQMYSLKYGTVPVVRKTGGLADTVTPFDPGTGEGTGIVFEHYTPEGVRWGLETALDLFKDIDVWRKIMANGMAQDFSWGSQARRYAGVYEELANAVRS